MHKYSSVLTLGDAMITLNPAETGPLRYVSKFERKVGGAELNFAIACARLGLKSKWISRLGNDEFGRVIYNFARGEGVDMDYVRFVEGHPTSLNFKEIREDGSGKTFYYRYQSPILTLEPDGITENMLQDVEIVHLTGVFLAIHPKNRLIAKKLIMLAKSKGIPISFDPNIRLKLWTIEEAREVYFEVFPFVDILLTGLEEIKLIAGIGDKSTLADFAKEYEIDQLLIKDGAEGSKLFTNNTWYEEAAYKITPIDTVGAGDGFDAGYIYSLLKGETYQNRLKFANAVGALVTTVSGDNEGLPYLEEVLPFINKEIVIER